MLQVEPDFQSRQPQWMSAYTPPQFFGQLRFVERAGVVVLEQAYPDENNAEQLVWMQVPAVRP